MTSNSVNVTCGFDATLAGLVVLAECPPRVARSSQPWAERCNPVGIEEWSQHRGLFERPTVAGRGVHAASPSAWREKFELIPNVVRKSKLRWAKPRASAVHART